MSDPERLMSNPELLVQFRVTYLRAIARAWNHTSYRDKLLQSPNVFEILRDDFDFQYRWPYLELKLQNNDAYPSTWQPVQAGGWIGPNDKFVLYIPGRPANPHDALNALAAYYQLFPTLFGPMGPTGPTVPSGTITPLAAFAGGGSNIFGGSGTVNDFLEFGAVMLRALALSWKNELFKKQLTIFKDPLSTDKDSPSTDKDPVPASSLAALSGWLGYNSPWNFDIHVHIDEKATWAKDEDKDEWQWTKLSKNRIEMYFPNTPTDFPQEDWPIALTAYNSTGPEYPFTCE